MSVTKVFVFARGSYRIHLKHIIENKSATDWEGRQYTQIKRDDPSREGRKLLYTYTGAVLSSPDNRYEKISFDDMEDAETDETISNGWAAMIQHYFLTAILPADKQAVYRYYTRRVFFPSIIQSATSLRPCNSPRDSRVNWPTIFTSGPSSNPNWNNWRRPGVDG